MEPHQLRVVVERDELKDKLDKLNAFINSDKFTELVETEEQHRLMRQANLMSSYLDVLNERILNF
jgi:hypothetical protein